MITDQIAGHIALMGIVGGQECAMRAFENLNNAICQTSTETLDIPIPKAVGSGAEMHEALLRWGFQIADIAPTGRRKLTERVRCPSGWSIKPTNHYLYKNLIDPAGQVRATIMLHYQDQDSYISLERKYRASSYRREDEATQTFPIIKDSNGEVCWVGEPLKADDPEEFRARQSAYYKLYHAQSDDYLVKERWSLNNPAPQRDTELADEIASKVLRETLGDLATGYHESLFETTTVFPDNQGTIPKYQKFTITTTFKHRDGTYADSGTQTLEAIDQDEALKLFTKRFAKRSVGYLIEMALRGPDGTQLGHLEDGYGGAWHSIDEYGGPSMQRGYLTNR